MSSKGWQLCPPNERFWIAINSGAILHGICGFKPYLRLYGQPPEDPDHTSIKERIRPTFNLKDTIHQQIDQQCLQCFDTPLKPLAKFEGGATAHRQTGILFGFQDYIELVDYTGRIIRSDKRGSIAQHLPPILKRLSINPKQRLENTTKFESIFYKKFGKQRGHLANTG